LTLRRFRRAPARPLALAAALLTAACGSRYHVAECPGDAIPDPRELQRRPGFDRLRYFRGTDRPTDQVDYEIWADGQFEFTATLTYHYPASGGHRSDCARAAALTVKRPLSDAARELQKEFIGVFARHLGRDLAVVALTAAAYEAMEGDGFLQSQARSWGPLVSEVVGVDSYHRGEFVTVAFYEPDYYRSARPVLNASP